MPLKLNQKSWNDPKKSKSRKDTIIKEYRRIFCHSIPLDKEYWTMCGQCSTPEGTFQEGCELDQILKSGLIATPQQFHGVDIDKAITESNIKAFSQANWHANDFWSALVSAKSKHTFNPAIVNADFINMPDRACGYFSDILALLSVCPGPMMVIGNMVLEFQRFEKRNRDMEFTIKNLNNQSQFQFALKNSAWKFDQRYYRYGGTGDESRTTMGTIIFYKKD